MPKIITAILVMLPCLVLTTWLVNTKGFWSRICIMLLLVAHPLFFPFWGSKIEKFLEMHISKPLSAIDIVLLLLMITCLVYFSLVFVLAGSQNNYSSNKNVCKFQSHLEYGSFLPIKMHLGYAKMLAPSLNVYLITQMVSGKLANDTAVLNLENQLHQQIMKEAELLRVGVQSCGLGVAAKNYLTQEIGEIEGILYPQI